MMGNAFGLAIPGLGMVIVWGLIVLLAVWLVGSLAGGSATNGKSARQILDERFAAGDIDRDEYEQRKQALS